MNRSATSGRLLSTMAFDWRATERVIKALEDNRIESEEEFTAWLNASRMVFLLFLLNATQLILSARGGSPPVLRIGNVLIDNFRWSVKLAKKIGGLILFHIIGIVTKGLGIIEDKGEETDNGEEKD